MDERYATFEQGHPPEYGEGRQLDAYALMVAVGLMRSWVGPGWVPIELSVEPEVARELARYDDLAACRIIARHGPPRMRMTRELLARPIPLNEWSIDRNQALTRLTESAPPARLEPSLRVLVRTLLPAGTPLAAQLAGLLDTSVRSLQRRLAEQGTTLSTIIDETRRKRATDLIGVGGTSVMDAALACGYTDAANFTRAFRRWTGLSPREFRRRQRLN
jgi:AraC-like DNA-binding protein